MTLLQLKANQKAKIVDILGGINVNRRLSCMGICRNREIIKLSHIGLRGPVVVKSGNSIIALGHGVAAKIIVELI